MWLDARKYQGYAQVQDIVSTAVEVVKKINLFNEAKKFYNIGGYYPEVIDDCKDKVNWHGAILYNVHTSTENRLEKIEVKNELSAYIPLFDQITQKIKKLPGISEGSINFYAPHSVIPRHVDNQWFLHNDNMDNYRRCVSIICGLDMPSNDPELCSLTVGNETKGWSTGEFIGFDGLVPHWGFNKTDKFRVTMLIETFADAWDIDQSTLAEVHNDFKLY